MDINTLLSASPIYTPQNSAVGDRSLSLNHHSVLLDLYYGP